MKRIRKGPPPQELLDYESANPGATWDYINSDKAHGGRQAAQRCRSQAILDQGGLCAYCEQRIEITPDNPNMRRIEHFHPQSDKTGSHNWGLDWQNMLAACDGGIASSQEERKAKPWLDNQSCDAYKNKIVQRNKLQEDCEGLVLNPLSSPVFPNLFSLDKGTGYLKPDARSCAAVDVTGNAFGTTEELVGNTIDMLYLNCERLAEMRRRIVINVDIVKANLRKNGLPSDKASCELARRYFSKKWPVFFTTRRCCLGAAAEDYLKSMDYQG